MGCSHAEVALPIPRSSIYVYRIPDGPIRRRSARCCASWTATGAHCRYGRPCCLAPLIFARPLDIRPEQMTVHGFRAMARTLLDEVLGFRPDFIEYQLAHAVRGPNGRISI